MTSYQEYLDLNIDELTTHFINMFGNEFGEYCKQCYEEDINTSERR